MAIDKGACVFMGCVGGMSGIFLGLMFGTLYSCVKSTFKNGDQAEKLKVERFPSGKEYYSPEHGYKEAEQIDIRLDRADRRRGRYFHNNHCRCSDAQMTPQQKRESQIWNECFSSGCEAKALWNNQPEQTISRSISSNAIVCNYASNRFVNAR